MPSKSKKSCYCCRVYGDPSPRFDNPEHIEARHHDGMFTWGESAVQRMMEAKGVRGRRILMCTDCLDALEMDGGDQ